MSAPKETATAATSNNERIFSPHVCGLRDDRTDRIHNLLFLRGSQDFPAISSELVARFGKTNDNSASTRSDAFAELFVVTHACTSLLGGELLRERGTGNTKKASYQCGAYHLQTPFLKIQEPDSPCFNGCRRSAIGDYCFLIAEWLY
ncbi:hypothetical protein [Nitrobacter sp. JJSN]|uniref:hypothetical protein n=1 Tax=Nitrobacter sp. JJSN TaxID=3453033 RepID=UPI003F762466